jgi:hypothetical protein
MRLLLLLLIFCAVPLSLCAEGTADTLEVPAFTAYSEPDPESIHISDKGVTHWTDGKQQLVWYGEFKRTGALTPALTLRLPAGETARFQLTVTKVGAKEKGQTRPAEDRGNDPPNTLSFGPVEISSPGYYRFALRGLQKSGPSFGEPVSLVLSGPAVSDAHFNLKPRRNAASVHLGYPVSKDDTISQFYNEVTVRTDPLWSYYMACGFQRGYFGIQVNSPTERRIIFSVWDSGNEAVDRSKVKSEDRVQLVAKGPGVFAGDFGNEGTGGHSHLVYPWKKDRTYRFLVTAKPEGSSAIYSGYFYFRNNAAGG